LKIGGAQAAEFHAVSDSCAGHTVQPGGSCNTQIAFAPTAGGAANATIAYTDNASGSPHTTTLTGNGTTVGALTGTVVAAITGAPLGGAQVRACVRGGLSVCSYASTTSGGAYLIAGLAPNQYAVEVFPPSSASSLGPGSALVTVAAGAPTRQDFALNAPVPLTGGVTFQTPGGTVSSGVPVLNWMSPFDFTIPISVPPTSTPNTDSLVIFHAGLMPTGSAETGPTGTNSILLDAYEGFTVHYDSSGEASTIDGVFQGTPVKASAAPDFAAHAASAVAQRRPLARPYDAAESPDASAAQGSGSPVLLQAPGAGHGGVSYPVPGAGTAGGNFVPEEIFTTQNYIGLNCGPLLGPYTHPGVSSVLLVGSQPVVGLFPTGGNGSPAPGGQAAYPIRAGGSLLPLSIQVTTDGLDAQFHGEAAWGFAYETFKLIVPSSSVVAESLGFTAGDACFVPTCPEAVECTPQPTPTPNPGPVDDDGGGDVYVDPSGTVRDTQGVPLAHARVTLSRSLKPASALVQVPNRSSIMSPANRRNPDFTNVFGQFGWDVLPGFYRVTATDPGCRAPHGGGSSARTRLLKVPPAVVDLNLTLTCPHLQRIPTVTTLRTVANRARSAKLSGELFIVRVTSRGRRVASRPAGTVTIRSGRITLATAALNPGTGSAIAISFAPISRHAAVRASYSGDAAYAPSGSRPG
jgi:Carboxypeptidase regulatory-like domain